MHEVLRRTVLTGIFDGNDELVLDISGPREECGTPLGGLPQIRKQVLDVQEIVLQRKHSVHLNGSYGCGRLHDNYPKTEE
jgi:hypothetical protein